MNQVVNKLVIRVVNESSCEQSCKSDKLSSIVYRNILIMLLKKKKKIVCKIPPDA